MKNKKNTIGISFITGAIITGIIMVSLNKLSDKIISAPPITIKEIRDTVSVIIVEKQKDVQTINEKKELIDTQLIEKTEEKISNIELSLKLEKLEKEVKSLEKKNNKLIEQKKNIPPKKEPLPYKESTKDIPLKKSIPPYKEPKKEKSIQEKINDAPIVFKNEKIDEIEKFFPNSKGYSEHNDNYYVHCKCPKLDSNNKEMEISLSIYEERLMKQIFASSIHISRIVDSKSLEYVYSGNFESKFGTSKFSIKKPTKKGRYKITTGVYLNRDRNKEFPIIYGKSCFFTI